MNKKEDGLYHDEFFRGVFSRLKNLLDLLRNILSKNDFDKLDKDSIKLSQESFISDKLKGLQSDMIIDVKIDNEYKKIAILIEHKAHYERFTLLQMLNYITSYWYREKENKVKNLTPIIPILFFHGKSSWNNDNDITMCFSDNLDNSYERFLPKFDYLLFDLNQIDDSMLEGNIEFKCAIKIMKNIHKDILSGLINSVSLIEDFIKDKALGNIKTFVNLMLIYVSKSHKVKTRDLENLINKIKNNELKEEFMTLENQLIQEGRKKGIQEGRKKGIQEGRKKGIQEGIQEGRKKGIQEGIQKGKIETAKKLKKLGIEKYKIAKATGLKIEEIEKL